METLSANAARADRPGGSGSVEIKQRVHAMKKNVGSTDRTIRVVLGVVILTVGLFAESWWGLLGLVPIASGMLGWCPFYVPFHFTTDHDKESGFFSGPGIL